MMATSSAATRPGVPARADAANVSGDSSAVNSAVSNLGKLPHVLSASNPLAQGSSSLSSNGTIGYSTVQFGVQPSTLGESYVSQLDNAVAPARAAGVQVEYGGGLDQLTRPKANDLASEAVGFAVALIASAELMPARPASPAPDAVAGHVVDRAAFFGADDPRRPGGAARAP